MTASGPNGIDPEYLRALVTRLRAYFEILHERPANAGAGPAPILAELRVWGTLASGSRGSPGTDGHRAAAQQLRSVALALAARLEASLRPEVHPLRPAVYDSRDHPGRYEIYVALGCQGATGEGDLLRQLRASARAIGLAEGQWRDAIG